MIAVVRRGGSGGAIVKIKMKKFHAIDVYHLGVYLSDDGSIGTNISVLASSAAPVPVSSFLIILLRGNGAVEEKILRGMRFIVS